MIKKQQNQSCLEEDHSLDHYISLLVEQGVIIHPNLQPAIFRLKNGLPYSGLGVKQQIIGQCELVSLPINLLLTSHRARKQQALQQIFQQSFYKEGLLWQDRILVTYLLYLLAFNIKSIWTSMVLNFSKDIDILSFWENEEYQLFVDKTIKKAATKQRQHFQREWQRYQLLQSNYFSKENYKWIYIHTISRCFGSYLNSTYFTPFCQLFNHNCVDVSYSCVNQVLPITQSLDIENQYHENTSVSSGYSQDYISDDDFDYMSINTYIIKWCSKICYDLNPKQTAKVQKLLTDIYVWMDCQLEWKGFSLIYLGQIIQKLKIIENQYKAGRKKYQATIQKIEQTKLHLNTYRKGLIEFYRSIGKEYSKMKNNNLVSAYTNSEEEDKSTNNYLKKKQQSNHQFTHFKMCAHERAKFQNNSQIFFCYGRLSNRTLLARYGFCIQNNLYEHFWIKFNMSKEIQPYPDLFQKIQDKGLSVNYKVKLKQSFLALQPILLFRAKKWQLTHHSLESIFYITNLNNQIEILNILEQLYKAQLKKYQKINEQLDDSKIGYHQYFARVYNSQKKKIIICQIELCNYARKILQQILEKKISLKELKIENKYQIHLKPYLSGLKGLISF